ncbi:MAG: hypothetical protein M0042_05240 [Nitrospiraceae bacterium]|nr:hypothetical protein [Nitrospiraceae bacterium]
MSSRNDAGTSRGDAVLFFGQPKQKQPGAVCLDQASVQGLKTLAAELGMPYRNLVNLYIREGAMGHKRLKLR